MKRPEILPLLLAALSLACLSLQGFLDVAPNRIVSGSGVAAWTEYGRTLWPACAGLSLLLAAAAFGFPRMALAASGALLCLLPAMAGMSASALRNGAATAISLGPWFWLAMAIVLVAALDALRRLMAGFWLRCTGAMLVATCLLLMAATGVFRDLSLAEEFDARRPDFAFALLRHAELVLFTIAAAVPLSAAIGLAAYFWPRARPPVFGALNVVQTIPSIAVFGLLMAPLAALGLTGIGIVPALIALTGYALLPGARAFVTGLSTVDPSVVDAGRGMGLSAPALLWRVQLPLAAPALLAGLRIMLVQTIGLAVVAALIGAGGLGDFVFQGLGEDASDLVLLGALPAIAMALTADACLGAAASALRTA